LGTEIECASPPADAQDGLHATDLSGTEERENSSLSEQNVIPPDDEHPISPIRQIRAEAAARNFAPQQPQNLRSIDEQGRTILLYGGGALVLLVLFGTATTFYYSARHQLAPLTAAELTPSATEEPTTAPVADATPTPAPTPSASPTSLAANDSPAEPDTSVNLPQIRAAYARSNQTMITAWRAIPAATRAQLLPAQQAWIREKAADCRAKATAAQLGGSDAQEALRLQCEMQHDSDRLGQLQQYIENADAGGYLVQPQPAIRTVEPQPVVRTAPPEEVASAIDCSVRASNLSMAICSDPSLRRQEGRINSIYQTLLSKAAPGERQQFVQEQRAWIAGRNDCTSTYCLETSYQQRLRAVTAEAWAQYNRQHSPSSGQ